MQELYKLTMLDPGTPAFSTMPKEYIGTMDNMKAVHDILVNQADQRDFGPDPIAKSMEEYWDGNVRAINAIFYDDIRIFEDVSVLHEEKWHFDELAFSHKNTWECVYDMRCDAVDIHYIIIEEYRKINTYCIFAKMRFKNLAFLYDEGKKKIVKGGFWGNPGVMQLREDEDGNVFTESNLFVPCMRFSSLDEAKNAMCNPSNINDMFAPTMDEIFGDG